MNVVHLRFSLLLHYLCINIYSYISHQLTILEKDPWVPAPESLCFLVSDILWSWVLKETVKISQTKELNPSELNLGGFSIFPHFFFHPTGGHGRKSPIFHHHLGEYILDFFQAWKKRIQVYSGSWSIPKGKSAC